MEGDGVERSTRLRLRTFIIGIVELMIGACSLAFHLIKLLETVQPIGRFLPDDEMTSHQSYNVVLSIVATILMSSTFLLFWGLFNNKQDWFWAWFLANSVLGIIYSVLTMYALMERNFWYMLEDIAIIGCTILFLVAVYPYYKWLCERNRQPRRTIITKPSTSKK